jgi:serine/threonine protein kinase
VIAVGLQLAGALAAVHAAGVVYRDLHPGNVLIDRGNPTRAWIFDFDQAQVSARVLRGPDRAVGDAAGGTHRAEARQALAEHGLRRARGTRGAAFSAASDVYALGLLLYRLLTGRRPFPVSGGEPRPPRELCPACPPGSSACS